MVERGMDQGLPQELGQPVHGSSLDLPIRRGVVWEKTVSPLTVSVFEGEPSGRR